ncbi:glycogen synthase (ADP-glucose) [Fibrobacter intestinalis]|uniref:starch synthase n=1 Tax=Fibrobacter intestinalis TaxID=28122 RepID=A0A1M6SFA4_9BACT|nr:MULTISPECIES: glycogen/starch synthase [Fibrobacter]MDD7299004.1 glycogen/starch synthase [Fibrobacter intestinalis]PBC66698.1 glycogen synthase (ADP-glucose) [Fibrobacter sp. UWS1]SHK43464.1 glycogen synthase (ADP-glucose) [Fibrobacter intestinalis]
MKFLSVSPEAGEWLKPSPLAGAVNQLTQAFSRAGTQILTISPFYPRLMGELENFRCVFKGIEKLRNMPFEVWTGTNPLYAYIRYDDYFNRPDIYGENKFPYGDNHLRFSYLASAALAYADAIHFDPTTFCGQDWAGALIAPIAKTTYSESFGKIPFFFTIHNITYDFHVKESEIERIGLPRVDFNMNGYEFWGKVSLLKAGVFYAKKVILPSPGYCDGIVNNHLGGGLSGFLVRNKEKLKGIQFGLNYPFWDFNLNTNLPIEVAKKQARDALASSLGVDFENRLVMYCALGPESGKTSETLATLLGDINKLNIFVVVKAPKNSPKWDYYTAVASQENSHMAVFDIPPNNNLSVRATLAGADILFAANPTEPSASMILKSLACGTVPLTGRDVGCSNLLSNYDADFSTANALLVNDSAAPDQMIRKLKNAEQLYCSNQDSWNYLVRNAYQFRYEWDRTISQFILTFGEE